MTHESLVFLDQAPFDRVLEVEAIEAGGLAFQLAKMGLEPHSRIVRLDEKLALQPVRIRGRKGVAVLSGGMGLKTIVHITADDRRVPILDMEVGEAGHLEGTTGGRGFVRTLERLGFRENDPVTLERKLPPMEFIAWLDEHRLLRMSEGDAARILGEINGEERQFAMSSVSQAFRVTHLLGGVKATARLRRIGVHQGGVLVLKEVCTTQSLTLGGTDQLMITSMDGLHLHLPRHYGEKISVRLLD